MFWDRKCETVYNKIIFEPHATHRHIAPIKDISILLSVFLTLFKLSKCMCSSASSLAYSSARPFFAVKPYQRYSSRSRTHLYKMALAGFDLD